MIAVAEKRQLTMHNKLLLDVIQKQAGTLPKAILEGCMNGIEAGATKIDITLMIEDSFAILNLYDDGSGIITKEEIEQHFEQFGTPHEDKENKKWAKFRMGRGQLFSYGKNTWKTSTFEMQVDIKEWGLDWHLREQLQSYKGCNIDIELYENPLESYLYPTMEKFTESVEELVRFMPIPIYFNGEQINTPIKNVSWDFQDENAYYVFDVGEGLKIYNLGAYVQTIATWQSGISGFVVSKKILDVNFARNAVQSTCSVYENIQKELTKQRLKRTKKSKKQSKTLTRYERSALLKDFRDGVHGWNESRKLRVFETAQGKWMSMNMLLNNHQQWSFAPKGSRIADRLMEQEVCLCLSDSILDMVNYSGEERNFFTWITKHIDFYSEPTEIENKKQSYIPYDSGDGTKCLSDGFSLECIILPINKLTKVEKRILAILRRYGCWNNRSLCIGKSDTASAWTDGSTRITMDRTWLKDIRLDVRTDITHLFAVLCHELAHDENTEGTHYHGQEFYEQYHTIIMNKLWDNPMTNILAFRKSMYASKMQEIKEKEDKKRAEQREKEKEKLGTKAVA